MKVTYDRLVPRGCRYVINGELVTSDRDLVEQGTIDDELVKDLQRYTISVPPTDEWKRQRRIACIADHMQSAAEAYAMEELGSFDYGSFAERCLDELEKIG